MSDARRGRPAALAAALLLLPTLVAAQDWRTITQSRQLAGHADLDVAVEYGAGRFIVGAAESGLLYRSRMRYDADIFEPVMNFENGRLKIGMEGGRIRGRNIRAGELELLLSRSVPLNLDLKFGAGEAELELGGLRVRSAHISTGASRTTLTVSSPNPVQASRLELNVGAAQFTAVGLGNLNAEHIEVNGGVGEVVLDFGGEWSRNATAGIEMGLGSLTIRVPRGLGVQVRRAGILAGFDGQGLVKRGDVYYSENWDDASRRLSIDVTAALGSVRVAWIDGWNGGPL